VSQQYPAINLQSISEKPGIFLTGGSLPVFHLGNVSLGNTGYFCQLLQRQPFLVACAGSVFMAVRGDSA